MHGQTASDKFTFANADGDQNRDELPGGGSALWGGAVNGGSMA